MAFSANFLSTFPKIADFCVNSWEYFVDHCTLCLKTLWPDPQEGSNDPLPGPWVSSSNIAGFWVGSALHWACLNFQKFSDFFIFKFDEAKVCWNYKPTGSRPPGNESVTLAYFFPGGLSTPLAKTGSF